ncbi:MAG: DUF3305 domain-containing protein [Pseudomonadota bacterium]
MANADTTRDSALAPTATMPVGVVVQRRPGVTRWVAEVWTPIAVLPGAAPATFKLLRQEGEVAEYHATTLPLTLHRADVEAYRVSLAMTPPSVFVVLRDEPHAGFPVSVHAVTASAFEAQDYTDSGEEIVEPIAMPQGLTAWVKTFADAHFVDTPFIKRQRDKHPKGKSQDGIGDARIRQTADVFRVPHQKKPGTP